MILICVNDAIGPAEESAGGTDIDARGVGAVIAAQNGKISPHVRKGPFFDALYPGAETAKWNIVLRFACHGASMAADTAPVIDDEAIAHERIPRKIRNGSPACGIFGVYLLQNSFATFPHYGLRIPDYTR